LHANRLLAGFVKIVAQLAMLLRCKPAQNALQSGFSTKTVRQFAAPCLRSWDLKLAHKARRHKQLL
jgi:hypothetical protein